MLRPLLPGITMCTQIDTCFKDFVLYLCMSMHQKYSQQHYVCLTITGCYGFIVNDTSC